MAWWVAAIPAIASLAGSMMNKSSSPYDDAFDQYEKMFNQMKDYQHPFYSAGTDAIPGYQNWLGKMKDPSAFVNDTMNKYQASPWSQYQQQQAMRAAQNMGSASGLTGSTPLMLQAQQNASGIASQDQQNWLNNVLGINSQYGSGMGGLIGMGQNSANAMTNMAGQFGQGMAEGAYGSRAGKNSDLMGMLGSGASIFQSFMNR